jgi:hypothetical protein
MDVHDHCKYHAKLERLAMIKYFLSLQCIRVYMELMACHKIVKASIIM